MVVKGSRTQKSELKTRMTAKSKPFFTTHFNLYTSSWRRVFTPRTLWLVGLDVLLVLVLLLFLSMNMALTQQIAQPLTPALQAVASLEAGGATQEQKELLTQAYTPLVNTAILQLVLIAALFLIVYLFIYALVKTRIWTSIRGGPFTWRRCWWNLFVTTVWVFTVLLASYGLLNLNVTAATILFILLAALTLFYLPLSYAAGSFRAFLQLFRWRPLSNYLFILLLNIVTWIVVANTLGLLTYVNDVLATVVILLWALLYFAWGRHYLDGFVKEHGVRHA